jgi:hypothetical protein
MSWSGVLTAHRASLGCYFVERARAYAYLVGRDRFACTPVRRAKIFKPVERDRQRF